MPPHQHTHEQQMRPPPAYLLLGIQHGLGITLQLFHVAKELLEEVLTGRLALQGQVHSQGLQDGTIVTQGGGVCQLGREPGELGQRQGRRRPAVTRRAGGCGYPACGRMRLPGAREGAVTRRGRVRLPGAREGAVTRRAGGCGYPACGRMWLPRRAGGCGYPRRAGGTRGPRPAHPDHTFCTSCTLL